MTIRQANPPRNRNALNVRFRPNLMCKDNKALFCIRSVVCRAMSPLNSRCLFICSWKFWMSSPTNTSSHTVFKQVSIALLKWAPRSLYAVADNSRILICFPLCVHICKAPQETRREEIGRWILQKVKDIVQSITAQEKAKYLNQQLCSHTSAHSNYYTKPHDSFSWV